MNYIKLTVTEAREVQTALDRLITAVDRERYATTYAIAEAASKLLEKKLQQASYPF